MSEVARRLLAVAGVLVLAGCSKSVAPDSSDLRQIGQASLIYANDHGQHLPAAIDVWDYARLLTEAGLKDGTIWICGCDPAAWPMLGKVSTVVGTNRTTLDPDFAALRPSYAVVLGDLTTAMPSTIPVAWTRGLQSDGTWAAHGPYGSEGGYIVFLGGNVQWYRELRSGGGQLIRYADGRLTSNILEALPPGVRIGEYQPTPEEARAWEAVAHVDPTTTWWWRVTGRLPTERVAAVLVLGAVALPFAVIGGLVWRSRRRGAARRPD